MTVVLSTIGPRPVDFVVDRTMYTDFAPTLEAGDSVDNLLQTGLRYHFCGTTGAEYWNALCLVPEYGHLALVQAIDSWFPDALRAALPNGWAPVRPMRMVSLGPGNGEIDVRLLVHLEAACDRVAYACVDSSFELLRRAAARIADAPELRSRFAIEARCADFTSRESDGPRGDVDIVSLLGGTLGNYREDFLIDRLQPLMTSDSYLLIDAWLWRPAHTNGERALSEEQQSLTSALTFPARNRFVFGPVEALTTASSRDVTFDHEANRTITVVPGAVNIVTYCENLRARMRLTDEPIERARLPLAATTRYEFRQLRDWFRRVNLRVCWARDLGSIGVFLLRRD